MSNQANAFIEKMKEEAFRKEITPKLHTLKEGDWKAVVAIGATKGFQFSVEEIKAAIPRNFYKGFGKEPETGWSLNSLILK